jgi:hypothetical protein
MLGQCFFFAFVSLAAGASDLDDFSNNLATDLGPLLALFGEQMTKQYLSESTNFVDYVIFAMAPIGVITAIVSVIRVCGGASLRALIGRAQEGNGVVEAELCTSTGRDVCELFNQSGITRVLGRPTILELVHYRADMEKGDRNMGLHIFRQHLVTPEGKSDWTKIENGPGPLHAVWKRLLGIVPRSISKRARPSMGKRPSSSEDGVVLDEEVGGTLSKETPSSSKAGAPSCASLANGTELDEYSVLNNPSLSLNVGIRKLPTLIFYLVATLSVILQFGVMAMAGLVSWREQWTRDGFPESTIDTASAFRQNRSALSFILGTAFLCAGMFTCAALIGEFTQETRYHRKTEPGPRLMWLQPGNQVVGEQTFRPYAYIEDPRDNKKRLSEYVISTKLNDKNFHLYTWAAVALTVGGYVAQFVGLRGMNAYVALAQLGITVVMSFLRGLLRAKRLRDEDNELSGVQRAAGHELDWLAQRIWYGEDSTIESIHVQPAVSHDPDATESESSSGPVLQQTGDQRVKDLVLLRERLAHLTGNVPRGRTDLGAIPAWEDNKVAVRVKARQLADAICDAAEVFMPPDTLTESVDMGIGVTMCTSGRLRGKPEVIPLILKKADPGHSRRWYIDPATLEAILSLMVWSIRRKHQGQQLERVVFLGGGDYLDALEDLELWLDTKSRASLSPRSLSLEDNHVLDPSTLWAPEQQAQFPNNWNRLKTVQGGSAFFGGVFNTVVGKSMKTLFAMVRVTTNDLTTECAHDLYSILLKKLVEHTFLNAGDLVVRREGGRLCWTTTAITEAANRFGSSGLGTASEASILITSTLIDRIRQEWMGYAFMKLATGREERLKHITFSGESPFSKEFQFLQQLYKRYEQSTCKELLPCERELVASLLQLSRFWHKNVLQQSPRTRYCAKIESAVGLYDAEPLKVFHDQMAVYSELERFVKDILEQPASDVEGRTDELKCIFLLSFRYFGFLADKLDGIEIKMAKPSEPKWIALTLSLLDEGIRPASYLKSATEGFASDGNVAMLRLLADFGVEFSDRCLILAAQFGQVSAVDFLLRMDRDGDQWLGLPALMSATAGGHKAVVRRLLADMRIDPKNALHHAIKHRRINLVKLLLEDGRIDVNHSYENKSPLDLAKQLGEDEIVELLQAHIRSQG